MADLDVRNVPDLAQSNLFDSDVFVQLVQAGRFRDFSVLLLRQLFSTSLVKSGTEAPSASDVIANTSVWYFNTTTRSLHLSLSGANFVEVSSSSGALTGVQIVALLAALEDTDRLSYDSLKDTPTLLTEEGVRDVVAAFIVEGTNITISHDDENDRFSISAVDTNTNTQLTAPQIVAALSGLTAGDRLPASAIRDLPASSGGGPTLNVAIRPPTSSDVIADTDYIWLDTTRDGLYISISGGTWQHIIPSTAIGERLATSDAVDYALQSPGSADPASGQIIYTVDGTTLKISEEDAETTANTQTWGHIGAGDQIWIGGSAVFRASATPTRETTGAAFWEFTGQWLRRDDELAGSDVVVQYIHVERSLKERSVHDLHMAPDSVGSYELKNQSVGNPELADGVVKPGTSTELGVWQRTGTTPLSSNGTFTSNATTFEVFYTNNAGTDQESIFRTIRPGDRFYWESGLNLFTVTGVSFRTDYATFTGTWASLPDQGTYGDPFTIYLVRAVNHIGDTQMFAQRVPVVQSDYSVSWQTAQQGQGGQTPVDIASGVYTVFGTWTWGSASVPNTGGFYVDSSGITFNNQDADGNDKTTNITGLAIGDRLQIGEVNALDITAAAVGGTGNSNFVSGDWEGTFDAGDFNGNTVIRIIKKNNIVVQGNVKRGGVLRVGHNLSIEATDSDDSIVSLWEGTIGTNEVDTNYDINAGELFSDYTHVIFNFTGSSYRNLHELPVKIWESLGRVEVSNKDNCLTVRRMDNNTFRVEALTGTIRLRKIHGYKGI